MFEGPTHSFRLCSVRSKLNSVQTVSLCLFPAAARAYHRPLVALSNPADQLQPRPAAAQPHADGQCSAK